MMKVVFFCLPLRGGGLTLIPLRLLTNKKPGQELANWLASKQVKAGFPSSERPFQLSMAFFAPFPRRREEAF